MEHKESGLRGVSDLGGVAVAGVGKYRGEGLTVSLCQVLPGILSACPQPWTLHPAHWFHPHPLKPQGPIYRHPSGQALKQLSYIKEMRLENRNRAVFLPQPVRSPQGPAEKSKLCPTLATPWTVAHQAPLPMGFPWQEYWSGLPFPSPGDFPDPGITLKVNNPPEPPRSRRLRHTLSPVFLQLRAPGILVLQLFS